MTGKINSSPVTISSVDDFRKNLNATDQPIFMETSRCPSLIVDIHSDKINLHFPEFRGPKKFTLNGECSDRNSTLNDVISLISNEAKKITHRGLDVHVNDNTGNFANLTRNRNVRTIQTLHQPIRPKPRKLQEHIIDGYYVSLGKQNDFPGAELINPARELAKKMPGSAELVKVVCGGPLKDLQENTTRAKNLQFIFQKYFCEELAILQGEEYSAPQFKFISESEYILAANNGRKAYTPFPDLNQFTEIPATIDALPGGFTNVQGPYISANAPNSPQT